MNQGSFKKALGLVILELRHEQKLSQERLAFEADVDRTRAGEIERGEANPTVETLTRIAKVLGHTLGTLIIRAELTVYAEIQCEDRLNGSSSFCTTPHDHISINQMEMNAYTSHLAKVLNPSQWRNSKGGS